MRVLVTNWHVKPHWAYSLKFNGLTLNDNKRIQNLNLKTSKQLNELHAILNKVQVQNIKYFNTIY